MKLHIICLCIVLFFSTCSSKQQLPSNPLEHFSISKKISPTKTIEIEKYNILRPSMCLRFKNWYVISDYGDMDNHIKFLSSDLSTVLSGVREGNGPLDIVGSMDIHIVDDTLLVMDPNHKKILNVDATADSLDIKVFSYESELGAACVPISGNRFINNLYSDSSMYQLCTRNGEILARVGYPDDKNLKKLSYIAQNSVYLNTKFTISPDKKKYAFGVYDTGMYGFGSIIAQGSITLDKTLPYYSIDIKEIYDNGGEYVFPAHTNLENVCSCTSCDKYAFFMFTGCRYYEMDKKNGTSMLIYTWDGDPYMRLDITDNVSSIFYDKNRNMIVGIAHSPEAKIVEYDMKGIID